MIFNRLEEKRTFFQYISKTKIIISSIILSALLIWSILIQTALKAPDEGIIHTIAEVKAVEFEADLSYVENFAKNSENEKIERLYSQFNEILNSDGTFIFLSISRDIPKNPKNN